MLLCDIKETLQRTKLGAILAEGIRASEPIPIPTPDGLLDNCFIFLEDNTNSIYSAPVARIGFFAEKGEIVYFISCYDKPFSSRPEVTFESKISREERNAKYPDFENLYNRVRPLFYKEECSIEEKRLLLEFADTFEGCIEEPQRVFYKEAVPPFFTWLSVQVRELLEEDNDGQIRN